MTPFPHEMLKKKTLHPKKVRWNVIKEKMKSILFIHSWKWFWDKSTNEIKYDFAFLTPFCSQKWYLTFFRFWLDKMVMNYQKEMKLPTISMLRSKNFIGLKFWPLFVTRNGILHSSAFVWTKWWWLKNYKWHHAQYRGHSSEYFVGMNFWPPFVTKHYIFCFSAFGSIKRSWVQKSNWNYPQFGCHG